MLASPLEPLGGGAAPPRPLAARPAGRPDGRPAGRHDGRPAGRPDGRPDGSFDTALARATGQTPRAAPARPLAGVGATHRPWEAAPNPDFRHRIAQAERSAEHPQHGYGQRNPASGAMGRYQFLPSTLFDLGWQDRQGNWSEQARRHGVRSDRDFLGSPAAQEAAQEAAMDTFLCRTEAQLERNGAMAQRGATLRGLDGGHIALSEGGLVAAAHRRGAGTVARWLAHRTATPDAPLSVRERQAFQQVERRLLDFAQVAYAPARRDHAPRGLAAAGDISGAPG